MDVVQVPRDGIMQGPTLHYETRNLWKNSITIGWPNRFFRTVLQSIFYENPVVISPGTKEYWEYRSKVSG